MSDFFQLPVSNADGDGSTPFAQFGLQKNPFPASGLDSGVLYTEHLAEELQQINAWINEVGAATDPERDKPDPVRPLAIFGSLGVGKTHLLGYLEQGLRRNTKTPVLRKGLADEGMTRLVLADLFLRCLPNADEGSEPGTGLLLKLVNTARSHSPTREQMQSALREGSPVKTPFFAAVDSREADTVVWLSRWLRREYTTPSQRSKLGLSRVLQSEGEAVRAVADLLRLAHAAGIVRAWFVFIDQLEELWRPAVITPTRRARFLTDLRHLVDLSLEGTPIALLLAWNTTVEKDHRLLASDVRERLEADYLALSQRMGKPVNLPMLHKSDVWPFAEKYLQAVGIGADGQSRKEIFFRKLKAATEDVTRERVADGNMGLAPRKVLDAWRVKADEIASVGADDPDIVVNVETFGTGEVG